MKTNIKVNDITNELEGLELTFTYLEHFIMNDFVNDRTKITIYKDGVKVARGNWFNDNILLWITDESIEKEDILSINYHPTDNSIEFVIE